MRKFLLFGFLSILFYQLIGFFTFVEIEHYFIRKEIKTALKQAVPENQLISFHFTIKESKILNWVKPHEFRLNGRFYDVVHKTKRKGIWYFKCIDDKQETVLFEKLAYATADNLVNAPDQHPIHGWLKLMNEPMEPTDFFKIQLKKNKASFNKTIFFKEVRILEPQIAVTGPPPENRV
ncbi:MAG: hypothetical protein ACKO5N_07835 [Sphingomonadales bacterium]